MVSHRRTRRIAGALTPLAAVGLVAGCMPGTNGNSADNSARPGAVATDPAAMGEVTLHILDYFTGDPDNAWMKDVVKAFEKKYPNITIERNSLPWDQVMAALPLKLKSTNPPDIAPANNGWQSLGTLVRGGLVLNLDNYAKAYGWKRSFPRSILEEHEFSPDGKQMGTGSLFGTPVARASLIEVYYNRALLKKIGAKVPHSYAEFQAALAEAKADGITPITVGTSDQVKITVPLFSLMNAFGAQSKISDFIYSHGKVKITQTGFPQAVSTFKQWADKGYLVKDYAGTDSDDAAQSFVNGKGLFHFNYSGSLPFKPGQSKGFGSFVLPRADGGKPVATASSATNFSIASKSKHADAAAAFLDFAASEQAAKLAVRHETMPLLHPDVTAPAGNPLFSDDVTIAGQISAEGTSVPYLDWTTPTMLDTINRAMQKTLAGKSTPKAVVDAADKDATAFVKSLAR
ncbi:extracellular solute-binding protein [Streptomyces sp. SID8361]|uniref:ABC transporter substrate-binding protein n=1 Tax=Streptomyces sp. MnatMP-M27 TaxID=1839768 RepID=UPI00081F0954|nr:extracellular solute-binding protein [Streptomyces sp. MnatMP-M27]MYU10090.1 extracellular solute-binding protein [Streptomyces sp. SID8361]SCF68220.1 raffinose/stachyose/melibiose transport system substrate-binding protein [Streptomyces sp. MnatMP-M27]